MYIPVCSTDTIPLVLVTPLVPLKSDESTLHNIVDSEVSQVVMATRRGLSGNPELAIDPVQL